jgi:hypothetical protein
MARCAWWPPEWHVSQLSQSTADVAMPHFGIPKKGRPEWDTVGYAF